MAFAGAMVGLLMASVFITASMLTLFFLAKDTPPAIQPVFQKFPPAKLALAVVAVSYPTWAMIGGLLGLLYKISLEQLPGGGIGSPNFVFTLAVIVVTVMMVAPFVALLGRRALGVVSIGLTFMAIFGWFLPYFAG